MDKGYGFIAREEWEDLFFHGSDLEGGFDQFQELQEGQEVEYDVWEGRDGKEKAMNVQIL